MLLCFFSLLGYRNALGDACDSVEFGCRLWHPSELSLLMHKHSLQRQMPAFRQSSRPCR